MTMYRKDNDEIPKDSNLESVDFKDIVSEGARAVLDAQDLIKNIDGDSIRNYSWKQTNGTGVVNLSKDSSSFSFIAPYVTGNDSGTSLSFELTVDNNSGKTTKYTANVIVKRIQRAIIFQGGVALGAYEAGVLRGLVDKISQHDSKRGINGRPLFDIVAGTSIGAMNAAIITSYIVNENGSWNKELVDKLERFWRYQISLTISDGIFKTPFLIEMWDFLHNINKTNKQGWNNILNEIISPYAESNPYLRTTFNFWKDYFIDGWYIPATGEASRRYYSAKEFKTKGTPRVASGILPWFVFGKFFDITDQSNFMPRPDNKHLIGFSLRDTLQQFAHFPLKSTKDQLRFLLVTVDVQTGDAITFDSYSDKAEYHGDTNCFIPCKNGIELEHVLASGTFPDFFDYPEFEVNKKTNSNKEKRIFWDGGYRSNTPLRELIQAHTDYWRDKSQYGIPDLEVYIADLWPSDLEEKPASFDHDFVQDRKFDIIFGDRTDYDEKVANVVSDYVDLAKQLRALARKKGASEREINDILDKNARSKSRPGHKQRKYVNLLDDRFRLIKVVRIDHKDKGDEVADKVFDYSNNTIEKLLKDGYRDTLIQMGIQSIKDGITRLKDKNGIDKNNHKYVDVLEEEIQEIQKSTRIENGHDTIIINQIENLIDIVRSIPERVNDDKSITEEKVLLVESAEELRDLVNQIYSI